MMHRFCPETADYVEDAVYDSEPDWDQGFKYGGIYKGQGQKMGLWVGAAWQKSFPNCTMGAYWGPGPRNLYTNHLGLLMDRDGQRFMNENCIGPLASQHVMMLPEKKAYAIWDAGYAKYEAVSGDWTNDSMMTGDEAVAAAVASWEKAASGGNSNYVQGDTVEEVVEKLGLPAEAVETVKRYNELAKAGEDADFHKEAEHLHAIEEGPFFGRVRIPHGAGRLEHQHSYAGVRCRRPCHSGPVQRGHYGGRYVLGHLHVHDRGRELRHDLRDVRLPDGQVHRGERVSAPSRQVNPPFEGGPCGARLLCDDAPVKIRPRLHPHLY